MEYNQNELYLKEKMELAYKKCVNLIDKKSAIENSELFKEYKRISFDLENALREYNRYKEAIDLEINKEKVKIEQPKEKTLKYFNRKRK